MFTSPVQQFQKVQPLMDHESVCILKTTNIIVNMIDILCNKLNNLIVYNKSV